MKAHIYRWVEETVRVAHVMELEMKNSSLLVGNAKLLAELEQIRAACAEADAAQSSLSLAYGKLEEECTGRHTVVEMLGQGKTEVETAHEAESKRFQDYCIHHRKKLCELQMNLESVMNEIGIRCLPHPGKGSTISEIVEWFDKEVGALSGAIMKANKNFLCYCLGGVLRMMYERMNCDHLDRLEAIMNSSDASLLDDIPDEIAKLSGRIVRNGGPHMVYPMSWMFSALCRR
jgi:hypothetical protein